MRLGIPCAQVVGRGWQWEAETLCGRLPEDTLRNQVSPSPLPHSDTSFLSLLSGQNTFGSVRVPEVLAHAWAFQQMLSLLWDAPQLMFWGSMLHWKGPGSRSSQSGSSNLEGLPIPSGQPGEVEKPVQGAGVLRGRPRTLRPVQPARVLVSPSGCGMSDKSLIS